MTTPKGINWNEQFYKLLRLSLGLTQEFPVEGVKGQESDIYKIQNLKYKQQDIIRIIFR